MMLSFLISLSDPLIIKILDTGHVHAPDAKIETVLHGIAGRGAARW